MKILFLTSSDVFHISPVSVPAKKKASFTDENGVELSIYSHGNVEKAQEDGFTVVIVSSRHKAMDTDTWWIDLVGEDHVHFMPEKEAGEEEDFTLFCQEVTSRYGCEWPKDPLHPTGNAFWRDGLDTINDKQAGVVHLGMRGKTVSVEEAAAAEEAAGPSQVDADAEAWADAVLKVSKKGPKRPDWLDALSDLDDDTEEEVP